MVKSGLVVGFVVFIVAFAFFALASHDVTLSDGTNSTTILEDITHFYNISVNNSNDGSPANIT